MDDVLVVVRLALSAVLLLAAVAKILDRAGARDAAEALGVPAPIARVVPVGLPIVEITLAAGLWPTSTAPWAAGAAAVLFGLFTVLVAGNLARGRHPDCHCFGALDETPISPATLVRNLALLGAAVFVTAAGARDGADVIAGAPWIDVIAFAGVGLLAATAARTSPRGRSEVATHAPASGAPAVGDAAPDFTLPDAFGNDVSLHSVRQRGVPVFLVFGHLRCGSCTSLLPDMETWQREHAGAFTPVFVLSATTEEVRSVREHHEIEHLLVQEQPEVSIRYGRLPAPTAFVIDPDGTIASEPVSGPHAIRDLAEHVAGRPHVPYDPSDTTRQLLGPIRPREVGDPTPDFRLPSRAGLMTGPGDLPGGRLGFVFTQRGCSQCNDLLDALAERPTIAERTVVVYSGWVPPLVPAGLSSPVLLDHYGFLAVSFGVTALPAAVRTADRVVVSAPVAGVDAILGALADLAHVEPIAAEDITPDFVPRARDGVITVAVDGTTVVGDPVTGSFHNLDDIGTLLWTCFDGTESLATIAAGLSAELGAPLEVVHADVLAFARRLGGSGALDGVHEDAPAFDS